MNVQINLGNPRTPRREREELIQRIYGKEKRPTGMRRSKDMINDFSIEELGWDF